MGLPNRQEYADPDPGLPLGGVLQTVSPTIFRAEGLRFLFFSLTEERMHVHVINANGEAKIWIEPGIEVARNHGLGSKALAVALTLTKEREDEIRRAWHDHFDR
jgi:hypothetical protein